MSATDELVSVAPFQPECFTPCVWKAFAKP